jgi:hypothetical protein
MSAPCVCSHAKDDHKCVRWDPAGELNDLKGTCGLCACERYTPKETRPPVEIVEEP